jgi:hypothetical protein
LQTQLSCVLRLYPSLRPGAKEFLHASMPEAPDHFV